MEQNFEEEGNRMREILFRGKCGNRWHYGNAYVHDNAVQILAFNRRYDRLDAVRVAPETVGQYTGLRDCNHTAEYPEGQMIFEGDILRCNKYKNEGVVRFGRYSDFDYGFCIVWKYGKGYYREDIGYWLEEENAEVIGNIHDNPELLKKGGEE